MASNFEIQGDLRVVPLHFFTAKHPSQELDVERLELKVDGGTVTPRPPAPLPTGQGMYWLADTFEEGRTIKLEWSFHTGIKTPSDGQVAVGYFFDDLRSFKRIQILTVERFRDYSGSVSIKIPRR